MWSAEQIYNGRPDYAVWHCEQCVEKALKSVLLCYGQEYEHTHDISVLLEGCMDIKELRISEKLQIEILYINRFGNSIRYKNLRTDPGCETAKKIIEKVRFILENIAAFESVKLPYEEAMQLYNALPRA